MQRSYKGFSGEARSHNNENNADTGKTGLAGGGNRTGEAMTVDTDYTETRQDLKQPSQSVMEEMNRMRKQISFLQRTMGEMRGNQQRNAGGPLVNPLQQNSLNQGNMNMTLTDIRTSPIGDTLPPPDEFEKMMQYRKNLDATLPRFDRIEDFTVLEKLGEGTYGVVSKARHKPSDLVVALKKVKLEFENQGIPATTIREVSLLKYVRHPNVVTLFECIFNPMNLTLVFEFVPKDMHKYLTGLTGKLATVRIQRWMKNIFSGINFCHSMGVLHRDLKPQNILVCADESLKIADFGLGREVSNPLFTLTHEVVTLWYRCPEILLGTKKYAYGVDTWSIGCIMAELFSQSPKKDDSNRFIPLFPGDCEIDQLFKIFHVTGSPDKAIWGQFEELSDGCCWNTCVPRWPPATEEEWLRQCPRANLLALHLIQKCITLDPNARIAAKHALTHPYFSHKHWDDIEHLP